MSTHPFRQYNQWFGSAEWGGGWCNRRSTARPRALRPPPWSGDEHEGPGVGGEDDRVHNVLDLLGHHREGPGRGPT